VLGGALLGGAIGLSIGLTRGKPGWRQAACLILMATTFAAPIIGFLESQRRLATFQLEKERRLIGSLPLDQRQYVIRALSIGTVVFLLSFAGFLVFATLVLREAHAERRRSGPIRGGRTAAIREVRIALAATFLPLLALIALGAIPKKEDDHPIIAVFIVFSVLSLTFGVLATVLGSAHLARAKGHSKWIALAGIPLTPWGGLLLVSLLPCRAAKKTPKVNGAAGDAPAAIDREPRDLSRNRAAGE
jgi:hypothetical protein